MMYEASSKTKLHSPLVPPVEEVLSQRSGPHLLLLHHVMYQCIFYNIREAPGYKNPNSKRHCKWPNSNLTSSLALKLWTKHTYVWIFIAWGYLRRNLCFFLRIPSFISTYVSSCQVLGTKSSESYVS